MPPQFAKLLAGHVVVDCIHRTRAPWSPCPSQSPAPYWRRRPSSRCGRDIRPPVTSPCAAEGEDRLVPPAGAGRKTLPRIRKQVAGQSTAAFSASKVVAAKVLVSAVVDTDGQPCDLQVVQTSHEGLGLEESSLDAVKQWEFVPATNDGAPVRTTVTIELGYGAGRRPSGGSSRIPRAEVHGVHPLPGRTRVPGQPRRRLRKRNPVEADSRRATSS